MKSRDIYRQVAELHISAISQGFLAELGLAFLTLLYEALDQSSSSVLIVDAEGHVVRGFVSGGTGLGPVYRNLLKRLPTLIRALWPVLYSYRKLRRLAELILHTRKSTEDGFPSAELYSIAVASEFRGKGVAEGLYNDLRHTLAVRGITNFKIVVGENLKPAQSFYKKMGATPLATIEVHSGARSTVFIDRERKPQEPAM